ncbi:MAG: hypothetical protein H0T69_07540, partial [Thermoleophilaceae bacterium]|nr:hypothetical protein [Thermoleophilaceae bacterium]
MRRLLLLTLAIAALVAGGCGSDSESGGEGAAPEPAAEAATEEPDRQSTTSDAQARDEQPAAAKGTAIKLADSQFG